MWYFKCHLFKGVYITVCKYLFGKQVSGENKLDGKLKLSSHASKAQRTHREADIKSY